MRNILFALLGIVVANCSKPEEISENSSAAEIGEEGDVDEAIAHPDSLPDAPLNAGQLALSVNAGIDPSTVKGYIVGLEGSTSIETAPNGQLYIDKIPPGDHGVIITAGTNALSLTAANDLGVRLDKTTFEAGKRNELTSVNIPVAGGLTGKVTRRGQTDHAGTDVYIPGTSYIAKTAADGTFSMALVPVGTHNVFFESDGYHRGILESVEVATAINTELPEIELVLSTGVEGGILIEGGDDFSDSTTVKLNIWAGGDHPALMKISEHENFTGSTWVPIKSTMSYTFDGEGSKTLWVMFADANGLESSPYSDSIVIDYFSNASEGYTTSFNVTGTIVPPARTFNFSNIDIPANATEMFFSDQNNVNTGWIGVSESASIVYPATIQSCGNKIFTVKFRDANDEESAVSNSVSGDLLCWEKYAIPTSANLGFIVSAVETAESVYLYGGMTGIDSSSRFDVSDNSFNTRAKPYSADKLSLTWIGDKANPQASDRIIAFSGFQNSDQSFVAGSTKIYTPSSNSWDALNVTTGTTPTDRYGNSSVWTGAKMIVWGGCTNNSSYVCNTIVNTGGMYNGTDTWVDTDISGAPSARFDHKACWTGSKMIVYGGTNADQSTTYLDGGVFDPATGDGTWIALDLDGKHTTATGVKYVCVDDKLVAWGGDTGSSTFTNTGAIYDGTANSWSSMSTTNAPSARYAYIAASRTDEVIIFAGWGGTTLKDGKIYKVSTNTWRDVPVAPGDPASSSFTKIFSVGGIFYLLGSDNGVAAIYKLNEF